MSPPNHDDDIQQLVADFLERLPDAPGILAQAAAWAGHPSCGGLVRVPRHSMCCSPGPTARGDPEKWEKGKGWGWVWGDDDELGNPERTEPRADPSRHPI